MQFMRRFFVAAFAAAALGACAPAAEQAGVGLPANTRTTVAVENNNWTDVVVYLVRSGSRTRLGEVGSMRTGEFRIPDAYVLGVSDITLQADPIGSDKTYTSPPIQVFPGARVALTVRNQLQHSDFAVFAGGGTR